MNPSHSPHPHPQISSPFDLSESLHIESHQFSQLTQAVSNAFNSLFQIIASVSTFSFFKANIVSQDPQRGQQILLDLNISNQDLPRIIETHSKFSRINDMMGEFIQTYFQDQSALTTQVIVYSWLLFIILS